MTKQPPWDLERVISHLNAHPSGQVPGSRWMRRAAVSIVMRKPPTLSSSSLPTTSISTMGVDILMIRRTEREGDPWSGHMAFPGGRVDPQDETPLAAAIRETWEELQFAIEQETRHVGQLSEIPAMAGGRIIPMVVTPFLFALTGAHDPQFQPNREVAEAVWIPLDFFFDPAQRRTMNYRKAGVDWKLPCYDFEGRRIWGLSLQMIDEMRTRLGKV